MTTVRGSSSPTPTPAAPHPRRSGPRWLWALLFVLAGNMLIDALEVSVVLVALPTLAADLGLGPAGAQWVMSGFALGFAAVLLLGPRVTARYGRRPVFLLALAVFAAASVVGGLTDSAPLLVASRVVKGVCAALTAPTGLAIITTTFPEGPRQRRAVSVYSLFGAAGFTVGLLLSGVLTGLDWRWTLASPAPVALLLLAAGWLLIPADDRRAPAPPPLAGLLRHGPTVRAAVCAAALNGGYLGLLLLTVFTLRTDHGWSPWTTALALLPASLPLAVSVPFAGRAVARFGTARLVTLGALAALAAHLLHLLPTARSGYATGTLPVLLLIGAAFVLSFAALNMQAVDGVPAARRAAAVPLYQTAVQLGAALTLLAVAALLAATGGDGAARLLLAAVAAAGAAVALTGPPTAHGNGKAHRP